MPLRTPISRCLRLTATLALAGLTGLAGAGCDLFTDQGPERADGPGDAGSDAGSQAASGIHLEGIKGQVEWRSGATGAWQAAAAGQSLAIGDAVRTASEARAEVVFQDGSRLRVKEGTTLDLSGLAEEFELVLDQGGIEVEAGRKGSPGFRVVFGESSEMVVIREGRTDLKREAGGVRIQMVMGQADLIHDGAKTELAAGKSFVMRIGQAEIIGRESVQTELKDSKRSSQLKGPNADRYRRVAKRTVALEPGTAIRTAPRGSVELVDAAGGKVVLGPATQAQFEGAFRSKSGRDGTLRLDHGEARVQLRRDGKNGSTQEVVTPNAVIKASAKGLTSQVTIRARAQGTQVVVHSGDAEVKTGEKTVLVKAGQQVDVDEKSVSEQPRTGPSSRIKASLGMRTQIYYDRKVSLVALNWPGTDGPLRLETSTAKDFDPLILSEPVEGDEFVVSLPPKGTLYWRVVRSAASAGPPIGSPGQVIAMPDPLAKRRAAALTNTVPDTGIKTTILFQGQVPALTFKWNKVEGAKSYLVQVYAENDMENPVHKLTTKTSQLVLGAGKMGEGTYFWYQTALGEGGADLKTSQMNKLVLAFDNSATLMRVDSPVSNQRPKGGRVEVSGLAPTGSTITVNGQALAIPPDGRFRQMIAGVKPGSMVLFKLQRPRLGEVYYLRHLGK